MVIIAQPQQEKTMKRRRKREKALTTVVVVLVGIVGAMGWYAFSKTSGGNTIFFCKPNATQTVSEVCDSVECVKQAAWILSSIEIEADPCDNFYNFVCNPDVRDAEELIPMNTQRASDLNILTIDSSTTNPFIAKVKDVYNACMNTEDSEMFFKELLINSLKDWGLLQREGITFDWRLFLYRARKHGLKHDMLFNFVVMEDAAGVFLRVQFLIPISDPFYIVYHFRLNLPL